MVIKEFDVAVPPANEPEGAGHISFYQTRGDALISSTPRIQTCADFRGERADIFKGFGKYRRQVSLQGVAIFELVFHQFDIC
jgi:hypothetical protein